MIRKAVCIGLIIIIFFGLVHIIPENLNQRRREEEPSFSMGEMIAIVTGLIAGMGILATIAADGYKEERNERSS